MFMYLVPWMPWKAHFSLSPSRECSPSISPPLRCWRAAAAILDPAGKLHGSLSRRTQFYSEGSSSKLVGYFPRMFSSCHFSLFMTLIPFPGVIFFSNGLSHFAPQKRVNALGVPTQYFQWWFLTLFTSIFKTLMSDFSGRSQRFGFVWWGNKCSVCRLMYVSSGVWEDRKANTVQPSYHLCVIFECWFIRHVVGILPQL